MTAFLSINPETAMRNLNHIFPAPPDLVKCPRCGTTGERKNVFKLKVAIRPFEGDYCQYCFAKWISENIPKLESVESAEIEWPTALNISSESK